MRGTPWAWCRGLVCALVLVVLAGAAPAPTQFVLEKAYPSRPLLGPGRALGAVIWNHGKPPFRGADGDVLPFYLDRLHDAGWDVFRLERDWSADDLVPSAAALREQVRALHERGYDKLVLAGQSYGAWISLMVAAAGPPVHAVIATAPAAFGRFPESVIYRRNADDLYPVLERIRHTRVMMFLFDKDAYDPGDRGAPARAIFSRNGVDSAVIAYPHGWYGHGAANWNGFATRFAPCMLRFIDPHRPAGDAHCERDPVTPSALKLALPDSLMPASASSNQASAPAGGLWYGV